MPFAEDKVEVLKRHWFADFRPGRALDWEWTAPLRHGRGRLRPAGSSLSGGVRFLGQS